jgi:hypothetical protein
MSNAVDRRLPRALTAVERGVLDLMLSVQFDGVEMLREQARTATVSGSCACGCPSVQLRAGGEAVRAPATCVPVPCVGTLPPMASDRPPSRMLLHVVEGWMRYLELVYDGPRPPTHWPPLWLITVTPSSTPAASSP